MDPEAETRPALAAQVEVWGAIKAVLAERGPEPTRATRLSDFDLTAAAFLEILLPRLDETAPSLEGGRLLPSCLAQAEHLDTATLGEIADWLVDELTAPPPGAGADAPLDLDFPDLELKSGLAGGEGLGPMADRFLKARPPRVQIQMSAPPPTAEPPADENVVRTRIHFATDREPQPDKTTGVGFGAKRADKLTLGECEVSFPLDRRPGELPRPSVWKLEFRPDPKKHVMLRSVVTQEEKAFYDGIKAKLDQSDSREAFVFIHGYNVSFEGGALRTAQLALDLKFDGAPILYSWPSNGKVAAYVVDHNNAVGSAERLGRFLETLAARTGAKRIHIIAHSMGNQALCAALDRLSLTLGGNKVVHHVALAAPDVDADQFRQMSQGVCKAAATVTLYASAKDKAIMASRKVNGHPRAGEPLVIVKGIDTVDASAVDTDFLSHGYFSDDRAMLEDLYNLIRDVPAKQRFSLKPGKTTAGDYYVFR